MFIVNEYSTLNPFLEAFFPTLNLKLSISFQSNSWLFKISVSHHAGLEDRRQFVLNYLYFVIYLPIATVARLVQVELADCCSLL